ncbi:MAG: serine/threonine protein kinase [Lachnospiraceae bacterium]|nr:serine/threonine protein kinase [Lachnospiraceae bacterium]
MDNLEYEEIELMKQSENGMVHLIREKETGKFFVRKVMKGHHPVYLMLQDCPHPCLPKIYEVAITEDTTTIIEEYIEGRSLGGINLSGKQFTGVVRDLCLVLEFLHGKGIIHRDIKPSNIIYTESGHICLIDFDAAREPKENREQDTRLLGTRGYAPPEQYGFSQTDVRTDIYSLGVTLEQILQDRFQKLRYKRRLQKCTELDPNKRYQTIRQVKRAFFHTRRNILIGFAVFIAAVFFSCYLQKSNTVVSYAPEMTAAERYPNQILWKDYPVNDYLGRYIDDIMEEMDAFCDEFTEDGDENICAYREIGIIFCFDDRRKIYQIALNPALCTYNGESLNVNRDKILEILGDPFMMGWTQWGMEDTSEEYVIDYYDGKEGIRFYMPSPEEAATDLFIE